MPESSTSYTESTETPAAPPAPPELTKAAPPAPPELTKTYLLSLDYGDFVDTLARKPGAILDDLTLSKVNLLHGGFGLASELLELMKAKKHLDIVNLIEEGGDFVFYHRLIFNNLGIHELPDPDVHTPDLSIGALIDEMCCTSEQMIDKIKRHVFYSKTVEIDVIAQSLSDSLEVVRRLAYAAGNFKLEAVVDSNRFKLSARFEGGYSNEKAINRDTSNERKVLEAATKA